MTQTELIALMKSRINIHLDRDHASIGVSVPFMVINTEQTDNVAADNGVYLEKNSVTLDLYCEKIDPVLEQPIKNLLFEIGTGWMRTEEYLDDEKTWLVEYTFDIL